ncbi:MAG: hypothetical protein AAFY00_12400 [Bacteroidota bacterium]
MKEKAISGAFGAFNEAGQEEDAIKKKESESVSFAIRTTKANKKRFNEMLYLKQYVVDRKPISQADVLDAALDLLAESMDYDTLKVEHAEELKNLKIKAGRKFGS